MAVRRRLADHSPGKDDRVSITIPAVTNIRLEVHAQPVAVSWNRARTRIKDHVNGYETRLTNTTYCHPRRRSAPRILYTANVVSRAGDTQRQVEIRADNLTRLSNQTLARYFARVDHRLCCADRPFK